LKIALPVFVFQSIPDFHFIIAIMIAIKNRSGKTGDRFSFRNRSAILRSKSDPDFHFEIDQRLKTGFEQNCTDGV